MVKATGTFCLSFLMASIAPLIYAEEPIPYNVSKPMGYSEGTVDPRWAYHRKKRGAFDREQMTEVVPVDKPSDLPPPTVVAPSPLPIVREFKAGKVFSKSDLKGEDAVFQRIHEDEIRDRCILNPGLCEETQPQGRQFIPQGELPPKPR
ncbi:hypothetical protein [Neptunomonas concharum]|uniref:DUF4124 domain-containing protein n=1 Tax=Neptunomonas concharum TaxID=1031538 RepID=A0A5P1R8U3_9GAMM|nr:hypothetical protein [Neptunomonas concharum]QEQ96054.1 hypothetical protein F0U83_04665 [Neptunomonas concharum]